MYYLQEKANLVTQPYHKFIFDTEKRRFIGAFEEMYRQEESQNFDSWFQDDMNHLTKRLALAILNPYNFNSILDFGCGKGTFTHLVKKINNQVTGIDISATAVAKASAKYPYINFEVGGSEYFKKEKHFELVIAIEVFSYLENWKEILEDIASCCTYFLICLFIPPNPIGFVKTAEELEENINKHFNIETKLVSNNECTIFFAKSRLNN